MLLSKTPPTVLIKARTLPEAWEKAVCEVLNKGLIITESNIKSLDVCSVIEITHPFSDPMLHESFPAKNLHMREYLKQWYSNYDWVQQRFAYNYRDRLSEYPSAKGMGDYYSPNEKYNELYIDQLEQIKNKLSGPTSRRLQAITWIPSRDLFVDEDMPCLQRLWLRNLGDNTCEVHCMWRAQDMFTAWNSNMVGLLTMLKEEILSPNNMRLVKVVDFCNSLHIYKSDWDAAKKIKILYGSEL